MIYTTSELIQLLGNFSKINVAINKGKYHKVSHGLYSDESPYLTELESLFARYPNAILTLESAFDYYGMSDYIPDEYVVATAQNAHKIRIKKVKQIFVSNDLLNIGKTTIKTEYGIINIYDKERMLIELFRLKSKLSYDYYKEVVNSYRTLFKKGELDMYKVLKYCQCFSRKDSLLKNIQEIIT